MLITYPFPVMVYHHPNRMSHNYYPCDCNAHFVHTIGIDSVPFCWQMIAHDHQSLKIVHFHESNTHDSHEVMDRCLGTLLFANLPYNLRQTFDRSTHCRCYTNRNPNLGEKFIVY